MKKFFLGKVQHKNETTGSTIRSARLDKGRMHLCLSEERFNFNLCRSCYRVINNDFPTVEAVYIHVVIQSGNTKFPTTLFWHRQCAVNDRLIEQ